MNVIDFINVALDKYFKDKSARGNEYEIALSKDLYDKLTLMHHDDLRFINPYTSRNVAMTFKGFDVVCDDIDGYSNAIHIRKKYDRKYKQMLVNKALEKEIFPDYETIVDRVLCGEFGYGLTRKRELEAAGYNYNEVQKKVNEEAIKRFSYSTTNPNEPWKIDLGIKKVIFNSPATIVLWNDGTKTVVKCSENDIFDQEKGLAMAIIKKISGNDNSYHKIFKKWCKEEEDKPKSIRDLSNNLTESIEKLSIHLKTTVDIPIDEIHELIDKSDEDAN